VPEDEEGSKAVPFTLSRTVQTVGPCFLPPPNRRALALSSLACRSGVLPRCWEEDDCGGEGDRTPCSDLTGAAVPWPGEFFFFFDDEAEDAAATDDEATAEGRVEEEGREEEDEVPPLASGSPRLRLRLVGADEDDDAFVAFPGADLRVGNPLPMGMTEDRGEF